MTTETQRQWCAMLAKLTSPLNAPDLAQAFVSMLPMLPKEDAAYNRDTLQRAARRDVGDTAIPNFDKIDRAFADWRRQNLPVQVRMGGALPVAQIMAPPSEHTDEDRVHVAGLISKLKAELETERLSKPESNIKPAHATKLQLALLWLRHDPDASKLRPDLRKAYEMHIQAGTRQ